MSLIKLYYSVPESGGGGWVEFILEILAPAELGQVGLGLDLFLLTLHPPVASQNSDNFTVLLFCIITFITVISFTMRMYAIYNSMLNTFKNYLNIKD